MTTNQKVAESSPANANKTLLVPWPLYITRGRAHSHSLEAYLRYSIAKLGVGHKLGQFVNWVLHVDDDSKIQNAPD